MQEFYSFAQHIYRSAVKSGLIQLYKSFLFQLCWLCRQICSTFVTINKHRTSPVILCFSNILTNVQIKMSYHFFNKSFGLGQHLHSVRQYNFWHVIDSRECDVTSTCDGTVLNLTSTCDSTRWCDILMSHQRDFTSMWCHINVMSHQCDINVMSHQWYTLQQCDVTSMWCPVWRYRVIRIKGAAEVDMTLHSYSCLVCAVHVHLQNTRPLSSVGLQSVQGYMNTGSSSSPACPPPTICSPLIGGFNDKRWNDLSYVCHSREGRGGVGVVGMGQGRWGGGELRSVVSLVPPTLSLDTDMSWRVGWLGPDWKDYVGIYSDRRAEVRAPLSEGGGGGWGDGWCGAPVIYIPAPESPRDRLVSDASTVFSRTRRPLYPRRLAPSCYHHVGRACRAPAL